MKKIEYCKVTAIIRRDAMGKVEESLQEYGLNGASVTQVVGYGEYADFYRHDLMTTHTKFEIFTTVKHAEDIAQAIMDAAHSGMEGDGIVVVQPVSKIYRIRRRAEVRSDDPDDPLNK